MKRLVPRVREPLWPDAAAMFYYWFIQGILREMGTRILFTLEGPDLALDAEEDDWRNEPGIAIMIGWEFEEERTKAAIKKLAEATMTRRKLAQVFTRVEQAQAIQAATQFRTTFGVDVGISGKAAEPWLRDMERQFIAQNVKLIKGLAEDTVTRIGQIIRRGVEDGLSRWEIADLLRHRLGIADTRAVFIARDQIGKLYGQLDRERQTRAGIEHYRWRTRRDERVRKSHRKLEGTTQAWDRPPENERGEKIIPGSDYNCRCWAEPLANVERRVA